MRVLLVSQHFAPEVTAARFRMQAFTEELVARGHELEVITAVPNHPQGSIDPHYRRRLLVTRRERSMRVRHVWVRVRQRKSFLNRIGLYASFTAAASLTGAFQRRPDVIVGSSPPLPVGVAGLLLAHCHRAPWVMDVRDVWPDSAVALGELTNPRAIAAAEWLERRLYADAAAIVTVNDAFAGHIAGVAPAGSRIEVVPNGTTRFWLEAGAAEPDRDALGLDPDRFIWAYAGNLGLAQGLEAAVDAATLLGEDYTLLIIGDGPRRAEIEQLAGTAPPGSVELRPLMAPAEAARHLRAADALLVSERQERTVASKLYDCCAIARPVVAACRGELRRVVEARSVAVAVDHGDPQELASAIRRLAGDARFRDRLVANGTEFAREHLRETQAQRFGDLLEAVGGRR